MKISFRIILGIFTVTLFASAYFAVSMHFMFEDMHNAAYVGKGYPAPAEKSITQHITEIAADIPGVFIEVLITVSIIFSISYLVMNKFNFRRLKHYVVLGFVLGMFSFAGLVSKISAGEFNGIVDALTYLITSPIGSMITYTGIDTIEWQFPPNLIPTLLASIIFWFVAVRERSVK